jgi:Tol biopolymer transport system component
MQILKTAVLAATAITLAAASLGTALAAFPGENGVIVYEQGGSLFKIAATGTGTSTKIKDVAFFPAVAPNGKQVAFMTSTANPPQTSMWVVNLDGSNAVQLAQWDGILAGGMSAWSPDGKTLAVSGAWNGTRPVYAIDVATRLRTLLFTSSGAVTRLAWSPLGDKIAYASYDDGDIFGRVIDLATGNRVLLSVYYPSWFPDQSGLLVGTSRASVPNGNDRCLARQNADGSNYLSSSFCNLFMPTVSPDGTAVVTSYNAHTATHPLTISDFDGGNLKLIAADADPVADWSRVPKTPMRTALANNQWSEPLALGGDSDTYISQSAVALMPDNGAMGGALRRAVGIGPDGRVYQRAQLTNSNWTAWALVPGLAGNPAAGIYAKQVGIAGAKDGSVQVVIVGANDLVYHAMRYTSGTWSGFNLVDGYGGVANFAARDVAIAIVNSSTSSPGQAHVAANGKAAGDVYHRVRLESGNWTSWGSLGNASTDSLALAFAGNADLYLLATTPTGIARQLRHPNGAWDGWVNVSQVPAGGLRDVTVSIASSVSTGDAVLAHVAYVEASGQVSYQSRYAPGNATSWTNPPLAAMPVMSNGRTVSSTLAPGAALELVVVQAQPQ